MYASMPQCEKIILGGSHDNGYVRILSKLEMSKILPGKINLLQGPTFASELERFDASLFPLVKFSDLFMERRLEPGKKYAQVAADGTSPIDSKATSTSSITAAVAHRMVEPELSIISLYTTHTRCMVVG